MPFFPALLYGGPDTIMPVASTLAAIGGFLLLFWQGALRYLRQSIYRVRRRFLRTPFDNPPNSA
jgi:hypothetical protein